MEFIDRFQKFYAWADTISDPHIAHWAFVRSPLPTYVLSISYIILAWKIGPWLMRNRQPYQLKKPLILYNAVMTYLNFHIFKELLFGMLDAGYSYPCQPYIPDPSPVHMRIAAAIWWYYISKLIEFADTLFFVLRKKNNQISFLHVYHHSTMPMLWWIGTKWVPGGQSAHAAIINAFIHIIMYSYYGLSALGPQYQKYLWWKRYLTQMQLIQFCIGLTIAAHSLYTDCDFPRWMNWALISYMITFLVLFGNFYLQAYIKKVTGKRKTSAEKKKESSSNGVAHSNGTSSQEGKRYELRKRVRKDE